MTQLDQGMGYTQLQLRTDLHVERTHHILHYLRRLSSPYCGSRTNEALALL